MRLVPTAAPQAGDPSAPVSIRVLVENATRTPVFHCDGCGCGNGISIRVLGPDGDEVALHDPHAVGPACPEGVAPLEPAGTLELGDRFTGVLYRRGAPTLPSPTYAAPPGTYTVIAGFDYQSRPSGESILLEGRVTFVWHS